MSLTGKQKRALRAEATRLKPEVWVGKDGISEGTIQTMNKALNTKELVKIKILENCPMDKRDAADIISRKSGSEVVQVIGNIILLYRPLPEERV